MERLNYRNKSLSWFGFVLAESPMKAKGTRSEAIRVLDLEGSAEPISSEDIRRAYRIVFRQRNLSLFFYFIMSGLVGFEVL